MKRGRDPNLLRSQYAEQSEKKKPRETEPNQARKMKKPRRQETNTPASWHLGILVASFCSRLPGFSGLFRGGNLAKRKLTGTPRVFRNGELPFSITLYVLYPDVGLPRYITTPNIFDFLICRTRGTGTLSVAVFNRSPTVLLFWEGWGGWGGAILSSCSHRLKSKTITQKMNSRETSSKNEPSF